MSTVFILSVGVFFSLFSMSKERLQQQEATWRKSAAPRYFFRVQRLICGPLWVLPALQSLKFFNFSEKRWWRFSTRSLNCFIVSAGGRSSGLKDGGEAGVGRLCVPAAVQYVWQKLSQQREESLFVCLCLFMSCTNILCDLSLFTTAVTAGPCHC